MNLIWQVSGHINSDCDYEREEFIKYEHALEYCTGYQKIKLTKPLPKQIKLILPGQQTTDDIPF